MRHTARLLAALAAVLLLALGAGFWRFVDAASQRAPDPGPADGIVVLTGGPERVETGLRLLAADRAARLLISGLGGGAELPELARRAGLDPGPLASRVTLGRDATSTRTNALETALWAQRFNIRSLIVVTAGFHMPRALAELRRRLPGVALQPAPVAPGGAKMPSLRALAEEYVKLLAAEAGLTGLTNSSESRIPDSHVPDSRAPDPRPRPGHAG